MNEIINNFVVCQSERIHGSHGMNRLSLVILIILGVFSSSPVIVHAQTMPNVKIQEQKEVSRYQLSQFAAASMDVTIGKSTLLKLPAAITRISVGSPSVADVMMIGPTEIYILGKIVGMTNMTLWAKDGKSTVIDVSVLMDVAALQSQITAIMPAEKEIVVTAAGDSLILSGVVSNTLMLDRVVALADAFVRTSVLNMMLNLGGGESQGQGQGGGQNNMMGMQGLQVLRQGFISNKDSEGAGAGLGSIKVINLLRVRDNQQVMLEVRVAEVNRTEAERLGFDFSGAIRKTGSAWTHIMAGIVGGGAGNFLLGKNLTATVDQALPRIGDATVGENAAFLVDAQKRDQVVKILAEPNIVAISGQEASFLVGGEILLPMPTGAGGSNVRYQSKQFGIGLLFTPTVLDGGRINLRVNPEVSELVSIQQGFASAFGVAPIATFSTRRMSTTVQLQDGQSLAIGGLLKDNFREQIKRFPMLGEVPVLGALFSSSDYQMDKTELMIIVTPRLVQPLQPDHIVPTDAFIPPGRGDLLIGGKLEGEFKPLSEPRTEGVQQMMEKPAATQPNGFQMR
jgi:pilus assembly protein CpaC